MSPKRGSRGTFPPCLGQRPRIPSHSPSKHIQSLTPPAATIIPSPPTLLSTQILWTPALPAQQPLDRWPSDSHVPPVPTSLTLLRCARTVAAASPTLFPPPPPHCSSRLPNSVPATPPFCSRRLPHSAPPCPHCSAASPTLFLPPPPLCPARPPLLFLLLARGPPAQHPCPGSPLLGTPLPGVPRGLHFTGRWPSTPGCTVPMCPSHPHATASLRTSCDDGRALVQAVHQECVTCGERG